MVILGATAIAPAELQGLARSYLGRPLHPLDLEDLRHRLTRVYVDRGYVNSGAVFDTDPLASDGTLTVRIIEGRLAEVQGRGLQGLHRGYLSARLQRASEVLHADALNERFQLLLADPLFARLNARLVPGDRPGEAVLDVDVTRARPWSLALVANNHVAPAVGGVAAGVEAALRNLTGWGDSASLTFTGGRGQSGYDLGIQLPLAATRTVAALRLARSRSSLTEEPVAMLDINSTLHVRELSLLHPLVDEARQRWALGLTHSWRHNRGTLAGEPFSFTGGEPEGGTRTTTLRLHTDLTRRHQQHVVALRASLLTGRNNLLEPSAAPQAPGSWWLWQLQGQAALGLGSADGGQLLLRMLVQRTADSLVPQERLAVGGRHTVRGYRENQLVRDNGLAGSAELHWPLWREGGSASRLVLVPFIDGGAAWNRGEGRGRLLSAGAGLQLFLGGLEAELFLARRLERHIPKSSGDLQDHGIHVALRWTPAF